MPRRAARRRPASDAFGRRLCSSEAARRADAEAVIDSRRAGAGVRIVDVLPVLHDELTAHRTTSRFMARDDYVFPTANGTRRDKDNARTHVVNPVVQRSCSTPVASSRFRPA